MSQTPHETINIPNAGIGDDQYPPRLAQNQASHNVSSFVDGSGHMFSMYLELASEEDKKLVENWKADADGILIFTGLFSAAVASLISVSVQDIRLNPQDTSNFYLANIYKTLADPNGPNVPSTLPASPPPFSPPTYAVWVNALWFMSLVISLTCALLATLLQQWARRYLKITQSRYSPHKRARIRAFFAEGVEKCLLPWAVETLPTLLHISLFLFFAGLVVFLCNVNLTIFKLVLSWVGLCTALYGCITCMPIFRHDSPYYTPLSLPAWHIVTGISLVTFRVVLLFFTAFRCFRHRAYSHFWNLEYSYREFLKQGMQKTFEDTALNSPSKLDARTLMWTFDCLDEDHELERFFSGLPGFRSSKFIHDPLLILTLDQKWKLYAALEGLLDRTFSSDLLPTPVKQRRAMICAKAIDPSHHPDSFSVLDTILSNYQFNGPLATGIAHIAKGWKTDRDECTVLVAGATLSTIIARAQSRDDNWFSLASNELGTPEAVLRDYAAHGDSLSLAILIHIVSQQFSHFEKPSWPSSQFSWVLSAASKFHGHDTSPELQHKFCALWNQIVHRVQTENDWWMAYLLLGQIRKVYVALHRDTDSAPTRFSLSTSDHDRILREPSTYPACNVPGHNPDSTAHIHDDHAFTTLSRAVPHDDDNTTPIPFSLALSSDKSSASARGPLLVDESLTDALPPDRNKSLAIHTAPECHHVPFSSPDPVTTLAIHQNIDAYPRPIHLSTPEPTGSTSPSKSKAPITPPDAVAADHIAALL
ncbi:hypothetical protein V8E53_001667 [Lactarius tabidus]